jgi:hypothetical protein
MVKVKNEVTLTTDEKAIIKALLAKGWRNQDIWVLINKHRIAPFNSGRITGIKKDAKQIAATDEEVDFYQIKKNSYDYKTGLNFFDDERLIRAREAMVLAVNAFNSGGLNFKTENFTMLSNVAWTYLMHEHYVRQGVQIINDNTGYSVPLSELIARADCPLSLGIKQNLGALKLLRDQVEHHLLGKADSKWMGIFQACCFNFDKVLCDLFGKHLSLANELSLALQFGKLNLDQVLAGNKFEVPKNMETIDASLTVGMTAEQIASLEFQFKVVYTFEASSKGKAHMIFNGPKAEDGQNANSVMIKKVPADELYPYKPMIVVSMVHKKVKKKFTIQNFQKEAKALKVRPYPSGPNPEKTDKQYCNYNKAHKDFTYNEAWVEHLVRKYMPEPKIENPVVVKDGLVPADLPEQVDGIEQFLADIPDQTKP